MTGIFSEQPEKTVNAGRTPKLMRRGWFRLVLPVGLLIVLSVSAYLCRSYLGVLHQIQEVRVEVLGDGVLTATEIQEALNIKAGLSFAAVDWDAAAERVLTLPRVHAQEFSYDWPHVLVVRVCEQTPVALLLDCEGRGIEITAGGVVFPPRGPSCLPIISFEEGPDLFDLVPGDQVELPGAGDLLRLLNDLHRDHTDIWCGISEAHLLAGGDYELYWNDFPIVIWGEGAVTRLQLDSWLAVISDLQDNGETDAVVDLRFRDQILVRLPTDQVLEPREIG